MEVPNKLTKIIKLDVNPTRPLISPWNIRLIYFQKAYARILVCLHSNYSSLRALFELICWIMFLRKKADIIFYAGVNLSRLQLIGQIERSIFLLCCFDKNLLFHSFFSYFKDDNTLDEKERIIDESLFV